MANRRKQLFGAELYIRRFTLYNVRFTEKTKNEFVRKFQKDEALTKKIEVAYYSVIELVEETSKNETSNCQIAKEKISKITIEDYTNNVYEMLCRIAILEEVKDDVASFEEFYEESIVMASIGYLPN